ncbi:LOW QUALITY PROTEIN: hypothetical protein RJ640_027310 [Escallonia rubra]|uniref:Uncharacterized protein n=1 Tax=Escallonia rubra TaxID=112253 RepID=A0AA88UGK9_9ASTE|nr:LOW QUALITY PROTEIN: hypothetical protein RJ640_027310 [Escallonia rubra]
MGAAAAEEQESGDHVEIANVREEYEGRWIYGLCGKAVKEEAAAIGTGEALDRHRSFRDGFRSSDPPPNAAEDLIRALKRILLRGLDSPRSAGASPTKKRVAVRVGELLFHVLSWLTSDLTPTESQSLVSPSRRLAALTNSAHLATPPSGLRQIANGGHEPTTTKSRTIFYRSSLDLCCLIDGWRLQRPLGTGRGRTCTVGANVAAAHANAAAAHANAVAAADQGPSQTVHIEPNRVQRKKLPVIQSQTCFKNTHFLSTGVHVRVPKHQSQPVKVGGVKVDTVPFSQGTRKFVSLSTLQAATQKSDRLRKGAELKAAAKEKFGRKNQAEVESAAADKAVAAKEKAAKGKAAATEKAAKGKAARSDRKRFMEALNSGPPPPLSAVAVALPRNADFLFGSDKGMQLPLQVPVILDPEVPRLRIGEERAKYRRKSEENLAGNFTGDYYVQKMPEKVAPTTLPRSASMPMQIPSSYWPKSQMATRAFPTSTMGSDQQVYMIPAQANIYHAPPSRRPMTNLTSQGYYAVQRMPHEVHRDQQLYNVVPPSQFAVAQPTLPQQPQQTVAGNAQGFSSEESGQGWHGYARTAGKLLSFVLARGRLYCWVRFALTNGLPKQWTAQGARVDALPKPIVS